MKDSKKKFGDRERRQANEGYTTVKTDLPTDRFQSEKQVLTPDQLGGADSPVAGNTSGDTLAKKAKVLKSSISVKPSPSVEELDGKQVGGVPLEGGVVTRSVAGFSGDSVSDDTSKIPYQKGGYRQDTRYGKKRSEDLFELDNTVSEQVVPVVEDALDLRESPDSKMGYNGRKQFKQTRSKKNAIGVPQTLLYDASVDIVHHNYTLATSGQMIEGIDSQADYPTKTYSYTTSKYEDMTDPMPKGNYRLESFNFKIKNGHITSPRFVETNYVVNADPLTRDEANHNWQVDANNVAKSMIRMQTELGRETTDKWSPLAYVVEQPYQYNMLMHDIEASSGAIMATAYRSAVSSLAYQRNIISKDGIGPVSSAVRMFTEGFAGTLADGSVCDALGFRDAIWNRSAYKQGSAAAIIAMFDSLSKYKTKADILGLQRSLPLHLSQADNNIDPFHVHSKYMKCLDKAHLFSTLDGSYNPMLPIHTTKDIHLINPLSLNYFLTGWLNPNDPEAKKNEAWGVYNRDPYTGVVAPYAYAYSDIRNEYITGVRHPIVEGLMMWMIKHERAIVDVYGETSGNEEVVIPANFCMTNPSMFSFMLCSASQYIAMMRNVAFRDILFAGEQSTYIWDDLTAIKDADPLHSTQLTIGEYSSPLKIGKMADDTALRLYWAGSFTACNVDNPKNWNAASYFCPWYMNERAFSEGTVNYSANEGFRNETNAFNMTIPSIRHGVRHEYMDLIKSMDDNSIRLAMDRYLTLPIPKLFTAAEAPADGGYANTVTDYGYWGSSYINGHVKLGVIRYENNSDGRVIAQYSTNDIEHLACPVTFDALLCIPKELGYIWDEPADSFQPILGIAATGEGASHTNDAFKVTHPDLSAYIANERDLTLMNSVGWAVKSYRVSAPANTSGAIDRSAALTQTFRTAFSSPYFKSVNDAYTAFCGIALSTSYASDENETIQGCIYVPNSRQHSTAVSVTAVDSRARVMWSMLQRFFVPLNPFENCYEDIDKMVVTDPLESSFYFGLCGTLASDYTQAVLERLDTFTQLGLDYIEDVNVKESLLFR